MARPPKLRLGLPALVILLAPLGCPTEAAEDGPIFTTGEEISDETTTTEESTGDTTTDEQGGGSCGDGTVDADEECDLGSDNDDAGVCTSACTLAACGDGKVYAGFEECDDGNQSNTDDCVNSCAAATCGDGFVHEGVEVCDDGNDVESDECTSSCEASTCGDGVIQGSEQCDDGDGDDSDECPGSCMLAFCGDGYIQAGVEVCDDGNMNDDDGCQPVFCVESFCGDGKVWAGMEECDDGNMSDMDACPQCMIGFCGDGFVDLGSEECDDANMVEDDFCQSDCIANGYSDDFETNNLMKLPWALSGNGNWSTTNNMPHGGMYNARSGAIGHSQSSTMELVNLPIPANGTVTFWYRVSSEQSFDYLRFYIDGVQQGNGWSGAVPWAQASYNVAAGNHTLRWVYSKDGSVVVGEDAAFIDDVYISN
jgi:cysteine-rich repeat protein